jgi:hypothetical protein
MCVNSGDRRGLKSPPIIGTAVERVSAALQVTQLQSVASLS